MKFFSGFVTVTFVVAFLSSGAIASENLIFQIETLISESEAASPEIYQNIKAEVDKDPDKALTLLLEQINSTELPDTSLAIYLWAISLTKSPKAVNEIIRVAESSPSEHVTLSARRALTGIGSVAATEYLYAEAQNEEDPTARYELLDMLATLEYEPAIPLAISILEQDPKELYWQSIFVFGKYGDKAVPFLLDKMDDPNRNVKVNSIMVLGQWLIPQEAAKPFKESFAKEKDPEIRALLLGAIGYTNSDYEDVISFSREVVAQEQDKGVAKFAQETIDSYSGTKKQLEDFKANKTLNKTDFTEQYTQLIASYGKNGDYEKLAEAADKGDEQELKKLKRVILQRNSDECFYDYQKVNRIIILNRMI